MNVKVLVENTTAMENLHCEHGLSLYIETKKHKILFDTGASKLFTENAARIGINLAGIDILILSHGHSDHGGGISQFLKINDKAKIYMQKYAFGDYYANRGAGEIRYIGLDKNLEKNERIIYVDNGLVIDEELELFAGVNGNKFNPSGNKTLFTKTGSEYQPDTFRHEQNLIIKEDGKYTLVAGCAHNGIVNIIEHFYSLKNMMPSYVIGGFHLSTPSAHKAEDPQVVAAIAEYLLDTKAKYYTGHCTGLESYERLKKIMGDSVEYIAAGRQFAI